MSQSRKDAAIDFLNLIAAGDVREAYRKHIGPDFRHHNPYFHGDADSLRAAMEDNAARNPDKALEVQCALEEGDRVAVFSRIRQSPGDRGAAAVHIFKFQGERISEFWDVGQEVPEDIVNENGMF